jgi:geranylgeranyl pyrophosphate synthase
MITKPVQRDILRSPAGVESAQAYAPGTGALSVRILLAEALSKNAPLPARLDRRLAAVISEAIANPGGLVRAEMAYEASVMNGLSRRSCEAFACAVEYFHTASLILDDLPAMDDSLERRGRICSHLMHGEGHAILGALALITRAYGLLAEAIAAAPWATQFRAHRLIEACLGTAGLINGQAQDLSSITGVASPPATAVALGKTAPMLRLALGLPAILAERKTEEQRTLNALSIYWGLLYQGVDDLIDETQPVSKSGKTSGRDTPLGRPSVVRQLGLDGTNRYLARLLRLADHRLAQLFNLGNAFCFLSRFQEMFRHRVELLTSRLPAAAEVGP